MTQPHPEPTLGTVLDDVRAAFATAHMPDDMLDTIRAFYADNAAEVESLRHSLVAVMLHWCTQAMQHTSHVAAEQVTLQSGQWAMAVVSKQLKALRGEPISPGRQAVAAHYMADMVRRAPAAAPLDHAGLRALADDLLDACATPIERDRDTMCAALAGVVAAHDAADEAMLADALRYARALLAPAGTEAAP